MVKAQYSGIGLFDALDYANDIFTPMRDSSQTPKQSITYHHLEKFVESGVIPVSHCKDCLGFARPDVF